VPAPVRPARDNSDGTLTDVSASLSTDGLRMANVGVERLDYDHAAGQDIRIT
jgi:hypothetical protein